MTEGGEKQPYHLPGRAYMVVYHMIASGVELGANTLQKCTAYGPTVCASCVKDDSIEIIKRSNYGVLKMVENNSVLRLNARFCFPTMSVSYLSNGIVCVR